MVAGPAGFRFYLSSEIDAEIQVRINHYKDFCSPADQHHTALYVEAELAGHGLSLGQSQRTAFAQLQGDSFRWFSILTFPQKWRDLPSDAQLALTVWQVEEGQQGSTPRGGTTVRLFSKKARLKTGLQSLQVHKDVEADLAVPSSTPAKQPLRQRGERGRIEHAHKRFLRSEMARLPWLDQLTLPQLDKLAQEASGGAISSSANLQIDLPTFPHAVLAGLGQAASSPAEQPPTTSASGPWIALQDPEVGRDNPAELKAQKLARSFTRGVVDRTLRPDTEDKRRIQEILRLPPNRSLTGAERNLLWRFRWSLTGDRQALTRVLQCVDWSDAQEARQAGELMASWCTISVADALELLSPAFPQPEVRAHAVEVLEGCQDEEVLGYLLQLVQALRYEEGHDSRLGRFLVSCAARNEAFAVALHWYLYVELEDAKFGERAAFVHGKLQAAPPAGQALDAIGRQMGFTGQLRSISVILKGSRTKAAERTVQLRAMLAEGGPAADLASVQLPLPLDTNVHVSGIVGQEAVVFRSAMAPLRLTLRISQASAGREQPVPAARPRSARAAPGAAGGAGASTASSARPEEPPGAARDLPAPPQDRYIVIYKLGDDLRQDQLVVQLFGLMDRLLKAEHLDLCLTPYRVLPTSADDGLVECITPSISIADVKQEYRGSILKYFSLHSPDPAGPFGVSPQVLDAFVRSCAGYCVMTYILGIGDRHLNNLMLTPSGRLFHIDFGYIFGRDPKPFPPPMKICREMVDAMGGFDSEMYRRFRTLACEAYNLLRKHSKLLLSLCHLMAGAAIPDMHADPEKALLKVQEKLRLDMDDEGASEWVQHLINESATAVMPQLMEAAHSFAQYWR